MHDKQLDDLLALAARTPPDADPALLDRVFADAMAAQAVPMPVTRARPPGLWQRLSQAFGGGAVLAGVTSTLILGLAVGYLSPATADYLTGGSAEAADLFPATDLLTTEG